MTKVLKKKSFELIKLIRRHEAISAITPSASWDLLHRGQIEGVRDFLKKLPIGAFANPETFSKTLNRTTEKPAKNRLKHGRLKGRWGAARKFLNLYLRWITYNCYLRREYKLDRIERLLELPMDSYANAGLEQYCRAPLPCWKGVSKLKDDARIMNPTKQPRGN